MVDVKKLITGAQITTASYKPTKPYTGKLPTATVKKGAKGTDVKYLQKFLNWCINAGLTVDGEAGDNTVKAIKQFQKKYEADGVFDAESIKKAKKIIAKYAAAESTIQDEIIAACKTQAEYMKNFTYKWQSNPTIEKSKKYGTCVTFVACVLQRVGLVKSGKYIWHDGKGYGNGKVYGDTSKFEVIYMQNKTFAQLKDKLKTGDVVLCDDNKSGKEGLGGHVMIFSGKWAVNGNPKIYDQNSATYAKKGKSLLRSYDKSHKILAICRVK